MESTCHFAQLRDAIYAGKALVNQAVGVAQKESTSVCSSLAFWGFVFHFVSLPFGSLCLST